MAAVIAALGTALSEVGAIVIVGGNVYGYDQTLASAALFEANAAHYADAVAIGSCCSFLILILMGGVSVLQQQGGGIRLRFRPADVTATRCRRGRPAPLRPLVVRRGEREVVHDVSVELRAGELVALLGPNGAGKSTLLDALGGALEPAQGTSRATDGSPSRSRRRTSPAARVLANVTLALALVGRAARRARARAEAALGMIGAEHLAGRAAATLSGGERRRVHIARTLAVRPDVLMLDEPFAGLDAEVRANLLEDALSAVRSAARATLVVVHDRAEAWALADRLLVLIDGRLVADGPPRELLEHPPIPAVARFLGYDGIAPRRRREAADAAGTRGARPARLPPGPGRPRHPAGGRRPARARVRRGRVYAVALLPAPRVGDSVRLRIEGGARFPAG